VSQLPVLTAVTDSGWEAAFLAAAERRDLGVSVVRRCLDLADLLAVASTGTARAALVAADLRRLDAEAIARLRLHGVPTVVVTGAGQQGETSRLLGIGAAGSVAAAAGPEAAAAALLQAVALGDGARPAGLAWADPLAALTGSPTDDFAPAADSGAAPGRLIAVWGPTGAPGRTTVAVNLATELALLGVETLLVDADVYGGCVGQLLGLLDTSAGVSAAARQANAGTLDVAGLARLARQVQPRLRVLTGIGRPGRWPEVRPVAVDRVLETARLTAAITVVDCGFCLERDDELAFDTTAPRRNGATLAALSAADTVLAVGAGDPVGLCRLAHALEELRALVPSPVTVLNKVRASAVGGPADRALRTALAEHCAVPDPVLLPWDPAACDAALLHGRALAETAPKSALRQALRRLAVQLSGAPVAPGRGWLRRAAPRHAPV
jgi:Flp pilus assembly CpaE family ATPase